MKIKKILVICILIVFCIIGNGCNKKEEKFLLNDKYYSNTSFQEINVESYNDLIDKKESFGMFIYQPLCVNSYEFNKVLTNFSEQQQISFYKMSFQDIGDTNLSEVIKYYPSFVIFKEGKIVDYLDADSNEDINYFKSTEEFKEWFGNYVVLKDVNKEDTNSDIKEENSNKLVTNLKLDNITYDENKVNIYFFWGEGCPHCEKEFEFFESIVTEYGDYFTLNTFEVWKNEDNELILKEFADKMGDEIKGVPYTIIGKNSYFGFNNSKEKLFLEAIKSQYKNSYDVYLNNKER